MKANKLFRKLALSGVALGAAAVTLTATTFAWYTSNTEATVSVINGMSEAKVGGADLYVASAASYTSGTTTPSAWNGWGPDATPVLSGGNAAAHVLKPVSYVNASGTALSFVKMSSTSTPETNTESPNYGKNTVAVYDAFDVNDIYTYSLRFHAASTDAVSLYFSEFNFSTEKYGATEGGYKDIIAANFGGDTGITAKGAYFADLARSLKLTIQYQACDGSGTDGKGGVVTGDVSTTTYDLSSFATTANESHVSATASAGALQYYNSVMKTALTRPATYAGTEKAVTATASGNTAFKFAETTSAYPEYVEVKFIFWLDGWDEYCYDCMKQQKFSFSFKASMKESEATVYIAA